MISIVLTIAYFLMTAILFLVARDAIDVLVGKRWPEFSMPGYNLAVKTVVWLVISMLYTLFLYKVIAPSFLA